MTAMCPGSNVGSGVGPAAVGRGDGDGVTAPAGVTGPGEPEGRTKKTGPGEPVLAGVGVGTGGGVTGVWSGTGVA